MTTATLPRPAVQPAPTTDRYRLAVHALEVVCENERETEAFAAALAFTRPPMSWTAQQQIAAR